MNKVDKIKYRALTMKGIRNLSDAELAEAVRLTRNNSNLRAAREEAKRRGR